MVIEYLGWAATAVFVGSYFCTRPCGAEARADDRRADVGRVRPADRRVSGRGGEPAGLRRRRLDADARRSVQRIGSGIGAE